MKISSICLWLEHQTRKSSVYVYLSYHFDTMYVEDKERILFRIVDSLQKFSNILMNSITMIEKSLQSQFMYKPQK